MLPSGEREWFVAGYFTFVDAAFRRLNCSSLGIFDPIRVGGNVQHARLIKSVPPIYPEDARQAGISGTVRLHAIIAKDGKVKDLELVSGHPLLAEAALGAVRQWTYQQTLLNGVPVAWKAMQREAINLSDPPEPIPPGTKPLPPSAQALAAQLLSAASEPEVPHNS